MHEFRMPTLGADMDAGTLVEWNVKAGDAVKRGQVVAVVETQKGAIEVEIWEDGIVERLLVATGAKVPVGEPLALVRADGEPAEAPVTAAPVATPSVPPLQPRAAPAAAGAAPPVSPRVRISPAARRLAEELGVSLETVQPAEPGGVVSREDVERAARGATPAAAAPAKQDAPAAWHARMRAAIAAAMSRSKREIPHYYLATDIDVTRVTEWLSAGNMKLGVAERLLPVVPFMKAVALSLREVPELNGTWDAAAFRPSPAIHLGMAIAMRGGGLVAPAIHDADRKNLPQLMADLRDLTTRVRGGRLRSSEMSDPTITLTSLGEQGVDGVFPVIYPPQVAIVGLGKVTDRPWVENGAVTVRRILTATLAADHRVSDGHRGALFLAALGRLLNEPEKLR